MVRGTVCGIAISLSAYLSAVIAVTTGTHIGQHQYTFAAADAQDDADRTGEWPDTIKFAVDYYPSQWPRSQWSSDAERMVKSSITHVRISEFDWALLEPQEGKYDWSTLDESIDVLGAQNGLKIILGTPTAAPPQWLVEKYDILGVNNQMQTRRFGSRRHYSFSSPDYIRLSNGIVEAMAQRYGSSEHVAAWQLDNEYGNSETARSYDLAATEAFRQWLRQKYGSVEELNRRQGRLFWSSQFTSFDAVMPPTLENEESSPAHRLDFFHFSSDQLIAFAASHAQTVRRVASEAGYAAKPITTNFMGFEFSFDHFEFVRRTELSFATWDSYPLGNAEMLPWQSEHDKRRFARTGLPDHQALHHALFRGIAAAAHSEGTRGPWGVMEQQPGPVNWALSNPSPAPGQVRVWLHDMLSQGSSLNNIFRWRQVPFGQEQMHAGMLRPDDVYDVAWHEEQATVKDVESLKEAGVSLDNRDTPKARVALVYDFTAHWFIEAEPQSGRFKTSTFTDYTFQYGQVVSNWHSALRRLALDVDIVDPSTADLSDYKLVLIPAMVNMSHALDAVLSTYSGEVIVGPRTGSKVDPMRIPDALPPSGSQALAERLPGLKVTRVESLRDGGLGDRVTLDASVCRPDGNERQCTFDVQVWSEWLECPSSANHTVWARFTGYREGEPAICSHASPYGQTSYVAWYAFADELRLLFADAAQRLQIKNLLGFVPGADFDLQADNDNVRWARRGDALFAFNYNNTHPANISSLADQSPLSLSLVVGDGDDEAKLVSHLIEPSGVHVYHVRPSA